MGYQVLARKWRPKNFSGMMGQAHVLKALVNALDHDRLHHAYLFTGTRGVGKTTIARILARCLNCEEGVSSSPCGQCPSCLEINDGRFVDLIEIDAASRTKVEDTREILDNVQYAPTRGRYKVYLIDEVHMLSTHSFNALLKTLEEPPAHVKFLLATTDPQKLPVTILSRCLQFSLKALSPESIVHYLQTVLAEEQVSFDDEALWALGRAANGSMRDALSLTDQAIAFGSGALQAADVHSMLGSIDRQYVFQLLDCLMAADAPALFALVADLAEHSPDYAELLAELIMTLHRIAVAQAVPDAVDNSSGDAEKVRGIAQKLTAETVQLYYQMALIGRRDLSLSPDARSGFEMVMMRMLLFRPVDDSENAVEGTPTGKPEPLVAGEARQSTPPTALLSTAPVVRTAPQTVKFDNLWADLLPTLNLQGAVLNVARNCVLTSHTEDLYALTLSPRYEMLLKPQHVKTLSDALSQQMAKTMRVSIDIGDAAGETPDALMAAYKQRRKKDAEQALLDDPLVQALIEQCDAVLDRSTVVPIDEQPPMTRDTE